MQSKEQHVIRRPGGPVALIVSFCVFCAALAYDIFRNEQAKESCAVRTERWVKGMDVWSRTFYCPRCNHVYDPVTKVAPASDDVRNYLAITSHERDDIGTVPP